MVVVGESMRIRLRGALPETRLAGGTLDLVAARGETLGFQIFHTASGPSTLALAGVDVRGFAVEPVTVTRASTEMYGGSQGEGEYPDGLVASKAPTTNPAYFEIAVPRDAVPGPRTGELVVAGQRIPVALTISPVTLPSLRLDVWAYFDQRELAWARGNSNQPAKATPREASDIEHECLELFRAHGVLLSPDLTVEAYHARKTLLAGFPFIPAVISDDPTKVADDVRAWIAATKDSGQIPFAIPIDEPGEKTRSKVRALAEAVRAAGGGPNTFRYAVTAEPHPDLGPIDLYIHWNAAHLAGDTRERWTYNGKPPRAGSMVVDTASPGMRTWGWIAHRYKIPVWYVWDALYWHDRHNRKGAALPGRALDVHRDSASFDDGEDHGNLDGVLALAKDGRCQPTLRMAALRRGLQDRALLELAATCNPTETAALAAKMIPRALGDAPTNGDPAWPSDEAAWEAARRKLLDLASCVK